MRKIQQLITDDGASDTEPWDCIVGRIEHLKEITGAERNERLDGRNKS
jgi:hypothetical protein